MIRQVTKLEGSASIYSHNDWRKTGTPSITNLHEEVTQIDLKNNDGSEDGRGRNALALT
jgi:hypothetical protein